MYKVTLAVTNDIVTDNRVHKVGVTLTQHGFIVTIVGRKFRYSQDLFDRPYFTRRFFMKVNKGPFFYVFFNLRFFFYLLRTKPDIIVANDLDTLLAGYLASKLIRKPLLLDSHEYFTELPELVDRKFVRKFWIILERFLLPRIKYGYTVSEGIAQRYKELYNVDFKVIRNVGLFKYDHEFKNTSTPKPYRIIIYQGVLNIGRGLELIIEAMQYLDNYKLWLIGGGDIENKLKELVKEKKLNEKVLFFGRVPLDKLWHYTQQADIGISLEEDLGLNYRFALPNKLFDYVQARLPVLISDLPEMRQLIEKYQIGIVAEKRTPKDIAKYIEVLLSEEDMSIRKRNLELAARELCWQREEDKLIDIYHQVIGPVSRNIS